MAAHPPVPPPSPRADRPAALNAAGPAAAIAVAAAAYASAELLAAIVLGRFFDLGRAEALLFLAVRPWLLVAAALAAGRRPLVRRAAFYGAALLLAAASQSLLLLRLGNPDPWPEALRGLAAGAPVAAAADLFVQLGRRGLGRFGGWAGAAAAALILFVPGVLRPYDALAFGPPARAAAGPRAPVLMMTGLPLVWGETGPFDPGSRPAAASLELQKAFAFVPVDTLDEASLARGNLLFLAQPQRLAPSELAALDRWVTLGGRAVVLADPVLAWPSGLPLGDIRRPPRQSLLGPLLDHWGLALDAPDEPRPVVAYWGDLRLALDAPGRLRATGPRCRVLPAGWAAVCRPGRGRALVVADADLLRDDLWAPFGPERHRRVADNPAAVARWLDLAAGRPPERSSARIAWADPAASRGEALAAGLLPIAACAAAGLLRRRRQKH